MTRFPAHRVGAYVVVTAHGELDLATAPELSRSLQEQIDDGAPGLVVDLAGAEFVDSTALRVLVAVYKRLRAEGGRLALACPHERILKTFRLTALDRVFVVRGSVPAALSALEQAEHETA